MVNQPYKRRFFQFGLRTLFLLTTIFAVWLGIHIHRARKQKEAVKAIRDFGGWVYYDFQETPTGSGKFDILDLQHTKVTSKGLEGLTTLNNLKSLWIGGTPAAGNPVEQVLPNCKISR